MALFFDQDWFQDRLAEAGQSHDALAGAAGLSVEDLAAVWKDQMEVTREMVEGFARVLGTDPVETASRCGVSTPARIIPVDEDVRAVLAQVLARLDDIDQSLATLHEMILGQQASHT